MAIGVLGLKTKDKTFEETPSLHTEESSKGGEKTRDTIWSVEVTRSQQPPIVFAVTRMDVFTTWTHLIKSLTLIPLTIGKDK